MIHFQTYDLDESGEISFRIEAEAMCYYLPPIKISYTPIINTTTQELGGYGWTMYYRSRCWGFSTPKIFLRSPDDKVHLRLRFDSKRTPRKDMICRNAQHLFDMLEKHNPICSIPKNLHHFKIGLSDIQAPLMQGFSPPSVIINNLQNELIKTKETVRELNNKLIKNEADLYFTQADLKKEITALENYVGDIKSKLSEYENETSLEVIQRLNRENYEHQLRRPSILREEEDRAERIFNTVREMLDKIHHATTSEKSLTKQSQVCK